MPAPRKSRAPSRAAKKKSPKTEQPPATPDVPGPNVQQVPDTSAGLSFGPEVCNNLVAAEKREWLVTNGLGGFASGTIAGSATRRYHGLLFAALDPPAARTLLVGGVDEIARLGGQAYELATHHWLSGAVAPEGYKLLKGFHLDGSIPVWTYQLGAAHLEKRIWMQHGENTTFVRYTVLGSAPAPDAPPGASLDLELKVLVNYRDFHSTTHAGWPLNEWRMRVDPVPNGVKVTAYDGATPFYVKCALAAGEAQHFWYRDFLFPVENERGLDDHEDQLFAAIFGAQIVPGQSCTLVLSTNPDATLSGEAAIAAEQRRQSKILAAAPSVPPSTPLASCVKQLVLAADQFIVARPLTGQPDGKSLIAGYHWFGDWGRDTMIALPGLTLATGRRDIAKKILLAFSLYVDRGMLPNNFPDSSGTPQYNTIDATLWYFEAIRQYFAATQDVETLQQLFPVLEQIVDAHLAGTRYNIHVDPADGLLYGGGPGVQLTWMDAKVGDWVVTPRTGKPVEINALWINALDAMASFAKALGQIPVTDYGQHAARARGSFAKFWNPGRNCCFDVLESPGIGNDASLRPNQIFAVSLGINALTAEQQKAVVDVCAAHLLTPYGLRTLAPGEPGYTPHYTGGPRERDAAYHQGTVWPWLLGPFVEAHYRVYQDRDAALAFLAPLANFLQSGRVLDEAKGTASRAPTSELNGGLYAVGTLPEIFDADPPQTPRGAVSQAWSVGELLRVLRLLAA